MDRAPVKAPDEVAKSEFELAEERRAKRRAASDTAKAAQYAIDVVALDKLEEQYGEGALKVLHVPTFAPGLPTMVVVKSPGGSPAYKRFVDSVREAKGHQAAIAAASEQLARACIVYPDDAVRALMLVAFPNLLIDASNAATSMVQLQTESEKKG